MTFVFENLRQIAESDSLRATVRGDDYVQFLKMQKDNVGSAKKVVPKKELFENPEKLQVLPKEEAEEELDDEPK